MYGYALRHPRKNANPNIKNNRGLTSLTLSCELGRDNIFRFTFICPILVFLVLTFYVNNYLNTGKYMSKNLVLICFREMLELSCKEFWRYSNITCCGYPLGALDSIQVFPWDTGLCQVFP